MKIEVSGEVCLHNATKHLRGTLAAAAAAAESVPFRRANPAAKPRSGYRGSTRVLTKSTAIAYRIVSQLS